MQAKGMRSTRGLMKLATRPMVSCIMPTADRRRFVPHAVRLFLAQGYAERELVVVDDGSDPVRNLMPKDPRIRYVRMSQRRSLGAKRNLACRVARGEVIVHWDDDDWAAAWRVSYQVQELVRAEADLCGIDRVLFLGPSPEQAWQYIYPEDERPWVHGGSLCYKRDLWLRNPFPDVNVAEDCDFIWSDSPKKMISLEDNRFYVGLIHDGNTSPKPGRDPRWTTYPPASVHKLLGDDWPAIRDGLRNGQRSIRT